MSLRARQIDARRHRILDAAALLIRQTGGTDFSMRSLAEAAETAPATPYNLFTSKDGLLYALLSRSLDDITHQGLALSARDPLDQALGFLVYVHYRLHELACNEMYRSC